MKAYKNAVSLLPERIRSVLLRADEAEMKNINEIRFRLNRPVTLNTRSDKLFIKNDGSLSGVLAREVLITGESDMFDIVFALARRSLHSYQDMIANGFIPLSGGCKAGVAGCAVVKNGSVYSVSHFTGVNIRIAREYPGCSSAVLSAAGGCRSFIIAGSPMSGKTTVLRDICRTLSSPSDTQPLKITVVDERDEIASLCFGGGADVGLHTDVLSLYPKAQGVDIALRTLSPDIIILDEIGASDEVQALLRAFNCGVSIIATAHAGSAAELLRRPNIKLLTDSGVFKKIIVLGDGASPCSVKEAVSL